MKQLIIFMAALGLAAHGATDSWQGEDLVETGERVGITRETSGITEYEGRLNAALMETRDSWGEALIEGGGARWDTIKDYLQPLLYSTGKVNTVHGMHNILYAVDGGAPPYVVAVADGSRLAANVYQSADDLSFFVGAGGGELFGSTLERLEGPRLGGGYYPVLHTAYTDAAGTRYEQESFASWIEGVEHLVAFVRISVTGSAAPDSEAPVRWALGAGSGSRLRSSLTAPKEGAAITIAPGTDALYLAWSPRDSLPEGFVPNRAVHEQARTQWEHYWDAALARGIQFEVPEDLVMDCQRNLLIQNLMLRWRYSLGSVVYHDSFYQPESSDAMSLLAMYGYSEEASDGLARLLDLTKGPGYYVNWERGEKLSHGAEYYLITRDGKFLETHTPAYVAICEELLRQTEADPHGLLEKQRHCGDIPDVDYCTFHQAVCWQGMHNMALAWELGGDEVLGEKYGTAAKGFRETLLRAVEASSKWLPDGSLFIPSVLLEEDNTVYSPITETRMGSYWNLCMPYAFASGLWEFNGNAMKGIVQFLHNHGATLLGLLRFNYYPVEIGHYHPEGLPGYWTTGYDNVYLPSYLRVLAQRDEAERLILSFYGKLAHGQTRGTFVSGEGDTVGVFPGLAHRSFYGAVCSANNMAFLLPLRLMLVRESFDPESGLPEGLHLAHATPRPWLEEGKRIAVTEAPTMFGPVSYTLESRNDGRVIHVTLDVPDRNPIGRLRLKVRPPHHSPMHIAYLHEQGALDAEPGNAGVVVLDQDAATNIITLDGHRGRLFLTVRFDE